jgi:Flp pilus assembly protein TadG
MGNRLRSFFRSRHATAAVEFALIVPVFILMAAGITEFGRYFCVSDAANRLATQYANVWSDCSDVPAGTCNTELSTLTASATIQNFAPQLVASQASISMFQITMSGSAPTVVYSYPSGGSLSAAQTTAATSTFTNGQSGVIVTVGYTHTLAFFPELMSPFLGSLLNISYTVAQLKS